MTQLDEIVMLAKNDDSIAAAEVRAAIIMAAQGVSARLSGRNEEFLPLDDNDRCGAQIGAPSEEFAYAYEE
jgi:hypothetical protein